MSVFQISTLLNLEKTGKGKVVAPTFPPTLNMIKLQSYFIKKPNHMDTAASSGEDINYIDPAITLIGISHLWMLAFVCFCMNLSGYFWKECFFKVLSFLFLQGMSKPLLRALWYCIMFYPKGHQKCQSSNFWLSKFA